MGTGAVIGRRPLELFSAASDEPYRRRAVDAVRLLAATGLLVFLTARAGDPTRFEQRLTSLIDSVPGAGNDWWRVLLDAGLLYALALVVVCVLARRRMALVVELVAAGVGAWAVGAALGGLVDGVPPGLLESEVAAGDPSYPALGVAVLTAIVATAAPHLSHPLRRVGGTFITLSVLATLFLPLGAPIDALGGLIVGWGTAALVHLALGASGGHPTIGRVRAALHELGVDLEDLTLAARQPWGSTTMIGHDGSPVLVRVYGRDAADAQFLAKAWRFAWYRDSGPTLTLSRLQQVEHEAYLTLLAARAGVATAEVLAAARAGSGDAVLAVRVSAGVGALADVPVEEVTDSVLDRVWEEVERLHGAGIAHGSLNAESIFVGEDGRGSVVDFGNASSAAEPERLHADRAELLASTALLVGEARAVAAALRGAGPEALAATLPFVQTASLTPKLRRVLRARHYKLEDLRAATAGALGTKQPELEQVRRVSPRDVVMVAATALAAFLLVSQLGEIDLTAVGDELTTAAWGFLVAAFIAGQTTNFADAASTMGAVARPVPLGPTVTLQFATAFTNLVMPSTVGRAAVSIRYFQKVGLRPARAVTQGVVDSFAGFLIQMVLVVIALAVTGTELDFGNLSDTGDLQGWVILLALLGGGLVVALLFAIPAIRRHVLPALRSAIRTSRDVISSPRNVGLLVTGNLMSQLLYATALAFTLRAYGESVPFAAVVLVNTGVALFAGLVPIPGGMGVAEGALTAGLIAVGVDETTAFTAAITHRLLTYYLPPIWGWVAFRGLVRNDYL